MSQRNVISSRRKNVVTRQCNSWLETLRFPPSPLRDMHSDAAGIVGSSSDSRAGSPHRGVYDNKRKAPLKSERRTKLREREAVATVMYSPWEASRMESISVKDLWKLTCEGDDYVAYHSELCADSTTGGPYRVGVGLSRNAAVLAKAIERLQTDNIKAVMKHEKLALVLEEAERLLPHLQILDFGKGSENNDGATTLRSVRRWGTDSKTSHTAEEIKAAVSAVHEWLQQQQSPLRGILSIMAGGGLFYSAYAAELTMRGWVQFGGATKDVAENAATTRGLKNQNPTTENAAASSDAAGIVSQDTEH